MALAFAFYISHFAGVCFLLKTLEIYDYFGTCGSLLGRNALRFFNFLPFAVCFHRAPLAIHCPGLWSRGLKFKQLQICLLIVASALGPVCFGICQVEKRERLHFSKL